jgi:hypothetical protein
MDMAKNKSKYILVLVLFIMSVLIVIPPIRYHYIYPTAGDDTASHLIYFHDMDTMTPLYGGQYLVGELVNALPFDLNVSFL